MADSIVGGLFGMTPESYQDTRQLQEQALALRQSQLDPYEAVNYMAARAGQQLGRGIGGALGAEDPQLKMISMRNALAKQFDINSPEGLSQYANALQQAGDAQGAIQTANLVNQATRTRLAQQQLTSAEIIGQREQQLQGALSQLPENASEDQIQGVLRRYGDPKTVLMALERKNNIQAQLDERKRIADEQLQFRREQIDKDQNFKREMANLSAQLKAGTTSLQQQLIQEKIDTLRQKKQDAVDKQLGSAEGVIKNTEIVLGKVKEAEGLIGAGTTGVGSYLSVLPGTSAKELSTVLGTIKARLGFDQLQQMRAASPTGGALGNVSNRELASLEGALASLDQGLSPKALRENLKQIETSYKNWQESAMGKLPAERKPDGKTDTSADALVNKYLNK
jgi:hypothetical protein